VTILLLTLAAIFCAIGAIAVWQLVTKDVLVDLHEDDQAGEGGQR